jgi:hypothetical protein
VAGYRFTDDWYLSAQPQTARDLLRRVEDWPDWWPSSLAVEPAAPLDPGGTGEAWTFTFQTRLPYQMSFQADVVGEEPLGVDTTIVGRVRGEGRWRVLPVPGGSRIHFDWLVDPQLWWMRLLSPLARPAFIWNHQVLMAEGARGFADELDETLLEPPGCTPPLRSATLQVGAALGLLAGLLLLGHRLLRRSRLS